MKKNETIYITTTLPYVNAEPHVGTVLEFVQADATARLYRLLGHQVLFNTGTDEHGQKIFEKAQEIGEDTQAYVDRYAATFSNLQEALNLSYDRFIRTTDSKHKAAAQEFWRRCDQNGDIYKKQYHIKYCVGCELEKTDSELVDGKCPLHPKNDIQLIDEDNYFFKLSKYNDALLKLYKEQKDFVVPRYRLNELISLIEREGLQDFSISRLKEKMPWGVPVPGDDAHVMYVWFDALVNYISTVGWPGDTESFEKWWPVIQFAGKDQVRQQAAMWQAMLLSAGLTPSRQIYIHGFVTINGEKISKSVGNVVSPYEVVEKYGTDALRYYYLRHTHPFEDSDFSYERFEEVYTAHLVNGIGNLASRIMKLAETYLSEPVTAAASAAVFSPHYIGAFETFEFNRAADYVWKRIQDADERIATEEPFKVVKEDEEKGAQIIKELVRELYAIAQLVEPLMPETAEKMKTAVLSNKKPENLFPRLG